MKLAGPLSADLFNLVAVAGRTFGDNGHLYIVCQLLHATLLGVTASL